VVFFENSEPVNIIGNTRLFPISSNPELHFQIAYFFDSCLFLWAVQGKILCYFFGPARDRVLREFIPEKSREGMTRESTRIKRQGGLLV
jgi:hypothetical protein